MENKKQVGGSSSSKTLDHLFGPKDPSSVSSSSSSGIFGSIFPPPSTVLGRDSSHNHGGSGKYGNPDIITKSSKATESAGLSTREKGSSYQNETVEPCYFSSSIYYGGQENYSPKTRSTESHQIMGETMEAIQTALPEGTGGRVPSITNTLPAPTSNEPIMHLAKGW